METDKWNAQWKVIYDDKWSIKKSQGREGEKYV